AHVIEAITHIESVSDKLPVTITSIQTARMMIASGDYIREHVLPITKDPQGFSEIADSMEEYGEKMKAETPKEFQAEFEKPPSDEEMFTWLLGKEAYTRLYSSYHRIHKIDPNNAMHHDEFTDYLQRRFGEILTQYPSERTTHGLEQAALSREKDVMSALHKRGKRELVTKLFARTSQERRDDLTKKKADNKPLSITEKWELMLLNAASDEKLQKKLVESIKERVGFDEAMADLTALRENQKEHGKNLTMIKQKENELITKLYDQVSLFPHEEESATPRTGLIRRTLNCFAKTQLLTELIQDTNIPVYLASIPGHVFCVVEFSDGTPCTFDANGFGIEPESPGYPNFF
ncbi:hypothetical protein COY32_01160, partial [candidate division WWE3 bacterium CG_4_10_14_0_2_um_filter_41_14]